ncbi:MAG: thioredoxin-disulfide reductase [Treponemataceae bacterium]
MNKTIFDVFIIGGGIAGLTAAQYAARSELKTILIEGSAPGGQTLNISHLENYPGLYPAKAGYEFIDDAKKQAQDFGANCIAGEVHSFTKTNEFFSIKTDKEVYTTKTIILATGCNPRTINIAGEKEFSHKGVSYCATCDGPFFRGKHIAVIGGGDSACDEATFLSNIASKITMIHRRDEFRAQAAVAKRVVENSKIDIKFSTIPLAIKGEKTVNAVQVKDIKTNEEYEISVDGVFVFVGMIAQTNLVETLKKDENGFIITDENMQTSVEGIFCAGDVRSKSFRQIVTAASDGAIAAHSAAHFIQNM